MKLLEGERFGEADTPGGGGLDEALVADEEDRRLVGALGDDPVHFLAERRRVREAQETAQGQRARAMTSLAASSTTGCPKVSSMRRMAVFPAPGAPVRTYAGMTNSSNTDSG